MYIRPNFSSLIYFYSQYYIFEILKFSFQEGYAIGGIPTVKYNWEYISKMFNGLGFSGEFDSESNLRKNRIEIRQNKDPCP